ncbi:MAG: aspartate aminotransferase family protein [Opitutae bacterium]|nr:aspartate aminotransferase family protein [Opitutae bacterium]
MNELLHSALTRATRYLESLPERRVAPTPEALAALSGFERSLPDDPTDPAAVLAELDELGSPATVASAGGRYFGFVVGGSLPVTTAANWLAAAWDQNVAMDVLSPVGVRLEEVALQWLVDLLGLPAGAGVSFVNGASQASFTALAAARHALLARQGWNVEARGLYGAPELKVVVSDETHVTVFKALALLGLGRERLIRVPVDNQGRMRVEQLPPLDGMTLVCAQAGNVNTGSFDDFKAIAARTRAAGAWLHIDGAFGLWAAAAPERRQLVAGAGLADSWAVDAHKWLNTPYDAAMAFVRDPAMLQAAMAYQAAYLKAGDRREPYHNGPELSRRARGVEIWAALRSLGRSGVADLIERTCRHAARFAEGLRAAGFTVLNDVVINQVLVSFGDAERTKRVIAAIQADGTLWCGGTVWQGHTAMRISVSSWATTTDDVERSLAAIIRIARATT